MHVGRVVGGRYRLLHLLGAGGMGEVYEAEQTDLRRRVAIKTVITDEPSARARFRQEALAMAKLQMPRVVAVLDFLEEGDEAFLVMERLDGETLAELLRRERVLPVARAITIATQVLEALGAAHRVGIVHRDVKPSNVFLVRNGSQDDVKLIDFGIAKIAGDGLVSTTTGAMIGTPAYMAPEQLRGERAGPASDVHAVGACLFEMLAGRRPWRSSHGAALAAEILRDEPLALRDAAPGMPAHVAAVIQRALAKETGLRYADANAMLEDLGGSARTTTRASHVELAATRVERTPPSYIRGDAETHPAPPTTRKTRPAWLAPVAIALVAGAGGGATVVLLRPPPPAPAPPLPSATAPSDDALARYEEENWRAASGLSTPPWQGGGSPSECWCAFDGVYPALCDPPEQTSCAECDHCSAPPPRRGTAGARCRGVSSSGLAHDGKLVCGQGRPPTRLSLGPKLKSAASNSGSTL